MYEYQKETLVEIRRAIVELEKMTDHTYWILIGEDEDTDNRFNGNLYAVINGDSYFNIDGDHYYPETELWFFNIKFHDDIFLKFNETLEKIKEDNKARIELHEKLNEEMRQFNEGLKCS